MHKNISIITLIIVASTVTGCAKFRELTRRDYALLKDPFLDRSAVSKVDEKATVPQNAGVSGVVQVADLSDSGTTNQRVTPASETRTASAAPDAKADFQGVRVNGMGDSVAQKSGPSFADFMDQSAESVAAAVTPSLNAAPDMEDFTQFVKGQAVASGMTETAKELDEDMDEWFAKQNEEWNQQVQNVEDLASPLIDPMRVAQQATIDAHPEMPSLPELGFGSPPPLPTGIVPEIATPLIQQTATPEERWVIPTATTSEGSTTETAPVAETPTASHFAPDPFSDFSAPNAGSPPTAANANPFGAEFTAAPKPQTSSQRAGQEQWNAFNSGRSRDLTTSKSSAQKSPFETPFDSPFSDSSSNPVGNPFDEFAAPKTAPVQQAQDSGFDFDSGWHPSR